MTIKRNLYISKNILVVAVDWKCTSSTSIKHLEHVATSSSFIQKRTDIPLQWTVNFESSSNARDCTSSKKGLPGRWTGVWSDWNPSPSIFDSYSLALESLCKVLTNISLFSEIAFLLNGHNPIGSAMYFFLSVLIVESAKPQEPYGRLSKSI